MVLRSSRKGSACGELPSRLDRTEARGSRRAASPLALEGEREMSDPESDDESDELMEVTEATGSAPAKTSRTSGHRRLAKAEALGASRRPAAQRLRQGR